MNGAFTFSEHEPKCIKLHAILHNINNIFVGSVYHDSNKKMIVMVMKNILPS